MENDGRAGKPSSHSIALAAAVKHSPVVSDFASACLRRPPAPTEPAFAPADWQDFLTECAHHDPTVAAWSRLHQSQTVSKVIVRIWPKPSAGKRPFDEIDAPNFCILTVRQKKKNGGRGCGGGGGAPLRVPMMKPMF
ncbi:MAG: DUF1819 family protein [Rhodoferax sp.]|nr:DUF1819 family protein [Rhodoferax sp.]